MKGMRFLLPAVLALASLMWTACDSRSVTSSNDSTNGREIAFVEVSTQNSDLYYSQATRTALRDTVTVLVLDAERSAVAGVSVSCEVQSSFGGALVPLTNHITDDLGEARYVFRVLAGDAPFTGDQTVTFVATAGNRNNNTSLQLHEQSDIQLAFLNPPDGTVIHRMQDAAETMPVQVFAYRDVTVGETTQRVGIPGILLNFSVATVGPGIPGVITVQGTTGTDGVTDNVFYANSNNQPADSVTVRFAAAVAGNPELSTTSTVRLANDYGFRLERILPVNPELRADILCADSTSFVFQYVSPAGEPVSGARFNVQPSMGELLDPTMYSSVSDEGGMVRFTWRTCSLEGGDLVLSLIHTTGRNYSYAFVVEDARPIELDIISPVPGGELEIDSECIDENVTSVRARLRYADSNNPIVGKNIIFSANVGQIGSVATTDGSGVAAVSWHDCDESDAGSTLNLSASFLGTGSTPLLQSLESYPIDLPLGTPHHITLSVANPVLPDPNSGALQSQVTATVYNSQNQRLGNGLAVGFKTNGVGQVTASAFTNEDGQAVGMFSLNNQTGISQLRAFYLKPNTTPAETLWSQPSSITVQSGQPVNVTLSTGTPRIQILGFGAASEALVSARVVDASGATVTMDIPVRFTLQAAPQESYLSTPGTEDQYFFGDTLDVQSQNGMAQMVINAGRRPGVVQVAAMINANGLEVYSSYTLVTIVAGPPAYGTLDFDPVGEQVGGGMWQVTWAAHFWDRYSNDVEDSTAVYFSLDPSNVASMDGFGMTGFDASDAEDLHGVAKDFMLYHCQAEGAVIDTAWAMSAGEVAEYDNPFDPTEVTGWHPGMVKVFKQTPDGTAQFQIPFQPGDRDDNLTLEASTSRVIFSSTPCGGYPQSQTVQVRATLRDGYGCLVSGQLIQFWSDAGGTFNPTEGITDINGQVETVLTVVPQVLDNTGVPCPDPNSTCFRWNPYNLGFGAIRQPGGPASDVAIITLERPCD